MVPRNSGVVVVGYRTTIECATLYFTFHFDTTIQIKQSKKLFFVVDTISIYDTWKLSFKCQRKIHEDSACQGMEREKHVLNDTLHTSKVGYFDTSKLVLTIRMVNTKNSSTHTLLNSISPGPDH